MKDKKTQMPDLDSEEDFLAHYDAGRYERPSVTVDVLVFTVVEESCGNYRKLPEKMLKLLLVRRGSHPFRDCWALPGGFVGIDESLDQAASRELREETGIPDHYMEQLYTWGDPGRDPRTRVISASYLSLVDSCKLTIAAGSDAREVQWFTVNSRLVEERKTAVGDGYRVEQEFDLRLTGDGDNLLSRILVTRDASEQAGVVREVRASPGLAFDHAKIIHYGLERLRNKIEYTDLAFHLMPERFTLTQLQQVYEVILGTELLKANFRRKIAGKVEETNETARDASGHRPSKLYRYRKWKPEYQTPI